MASFPSNNQFSPDKIDELFRVRERNFSVVSAYYFGNEAKNKAPFLHTTFIRVEYRDQATQSPLRVMEAL